MKQISMVNNATIAGLETDVNTELGVLRTATPDGRSFVVVDIKYAVASLAGGDDYSAMIIYSYI